VLGLGIVLALVIGVASAKKPPKPPPDPVDSGLIYFRNIGTTFYSMEPDGSNKTTLTGPIGTTASLHDGQRWYIEYVWNSVDKVDEFWAVRQDGEERFQLHFDSPDVYPSKGWNLKWATHNGVADGKVSFLGINADAPEESGLQVIYVDWATKGSTPEDSLIPIGPCEYNSTTQKYQFWVDYCWSPAGTSVVYNNELDTQGLLRIDEADEWSATEIHADGGSDPQWSPDGTQIAFVINNHPAPISAYDLWKTDIEVVAPDGSGNEILVAHTGKTGADRPLWSPSGSHLVYTQWGSPPRYMNAIYADVYRVTSSGGDKTNLTPDWSWKLLTVAWLDD
jgi:dipeptidyl aminopeptidase/acylaminoacyl peptidase